MLDPKNLIAFGVVAVAAMAAYKLGYEQGTVDGKLMERGNNPDGVPLPPITLYEDRKGA